MNDSDDRQIKESKMKKMLVLVVVLGVLLAGCNFKSRDFRVLGYCEADGLYYVEHKKSGEIFSSSTCGKFCHRFRNKDYCPILELAPEPEIAAKPLFRMWLLLNGEKMCMIVSETHPSVERQQILCGWVADRAPCADYVYDNDTWGCDSFGGLRLPLWGPGKDLMDVWRAHKAREQ